LNTYAKLHNYTDYIESTCEDDEIDFSLIESIYKNVELFKETYIDFRKETTKKLKEKLHLNKIEP
jgi:oligoendopeptidase F